MVEKEALFWRYGDSIETLGRQGFAQKQEKN